VKNDIFGWFFSDLASLGGILLSFDSFCYNRDPSMKNTREYRRGEWAYWGWWWRITRSQRKQGKFQSRWASLYTWLTYDTAHWSKQYYNSCLLPLELLKIIFGPGGDLCPQFLWGSCCSIFSFMCSVM
jgi:hypothetical protein